MVEQPSEQASDQVRDEDGRYRFMPTEADHDAAMASLLAVLDLHAEGTDTSGQDLFTAPSQATPHGRVFGGQVLGQALTAVSNTIEPATPVHSMHAYFLRAGDASKPITFRVERLRDGRSFSARRVHALQHDQPILTLSASFQVPDQGGLDHQVPMPDVPGPDELPSFAETVAQIDHPLTRFMAQTRPFDVRHVLQPVVAQPDPERRSHNSVWMRPVRPLPEGVHLHSAVLAYASDYTLLESVLRQHGMAWSFPMKVASLDHAMWWHRHVPVDQWLLFTQWSPFAGGGRGLGAGRIYTQDGTLVASVVQEGMIRPLPRD